MTVSQSQLADYIKKEIDRYHGIMVPVEASLMERKTVRAVSPKKLHPNPDDEFCDPSIGPNDEIISGYVKNISIYHSLKANIWDESVIVQKVHPDGYMILNGHHRWAAALRTNLKKVPVSIVNLTRESDIKRMIDNAKSDRRVTLDLDEVVFCSSDEIPAEKPLPPKVFCLPSENYKEKIRLGIPALLHYLTSEGYDIWVYSADFYSRDYIQSIFKRYSVRIAGVVTGTGLKSRHRDEAGENIARLMADQYKETYHIDENMVLITRRDSKDFEEYAINADPSKWSGEVMKIVKGRKKDGQD